MKKININSFEKFSAEIKEYDQSVIYRGVPKVEYDLRPSLFWFNKPTIPGNLEKRIMQLFKTRGRGYIKEIPNSEIEWLVLARHYDLPTRLLDWSSNPLVACYFAVSSHTEEDGVIYIYDTDNYISESNIDISNLRSIKAFHPSYLSNRLIAQSSVFTIHPDSEPVLTAKEIEKIIIVESSIKDEFKEILNKYGIHEASLFPGLDSLAKHIKYQLEE